MMLWLYFKGLSAVKNIAGVIRVFKINRKGS